MSVTSRNRTTLAIILALPFLLLMLLVPPVGDFPLNDDWVYAKMVQRLADDGHFGFSKFSNAFAITQTLYAAPLVKVFGFSFTLLRLTTIFMAWLTVCFTAFTARELGLSNRGALLAALTVFVNPLFINLSYTFMTEIPFCAFATVSTFFYVKSLRAPTAKNLLLGTAFSILAFYNRQFGALIPIAFLVSALWSFRGKTFQHGRAAAMCILLPWLFALAPIVWLQVPASERLLVQTSGEEPHQMHFQGWLPLWVLLYLGLFMLPFTAAIAHLWKRGEWNYRRSSARRIVWAALGVALGFVAWFTFPVLPNLLRNMGVGPALFSILQPPGMPGVRFAPVQLDGFFFGLAVVYSAVVVSNTLERTLVSDAPTLHIQTARLRFLALSALFLLLAPALALGWPYFDRYLVPAIIPVSLLLAYAVGHRIRSMPLNAAGLCVAVLCTFSVIALQDYMAWNVARWQAIDRLRTQYHASDTEIDGGFEFNGMYTSDAYLANSGWTVPRKPWWVVGDTYRLSPVTLIRQHESYDVIDQVPYYSWLGFDTRYIYILRKIDESAKPS